MLYHVEIKGCVSIKQAHSGAGSARGWLVTKLVVKHTVILRMNDSRQLSAYGLTSFIPT